MIKILVIDDEAGIRSAIEDNFSYIGFTVFTAVNAAKGLSIFSKERPKIIFLDIRLPDKNGLELLSELKQIDPNCIVIMITAIEDNDNALLKKAMDLGASEFIQKPLRRNELRDMVLVKVKNIMDQGGHMQKPRILITDDESVVLKGMKNTIAKWFEADIETASSGEEAIEKAKIFKPDLILLDIRMPGINGLEAIPEIRKYVPDVRIVIASAWNSMEVSNQAATLGVVDYITKPCLPEKIAEKVKIVLMSLGKLIFKEQK